MLNTYRKFTDTWEVVYLSDKTDEGYYCEFVWWEDNYIFDIHFLLENSKKATLLDVIKYKLWKIIW